MTTSKTPSGALSALAIFMALSFSATRGIGQTPSQPPSAAVPAQPSLIESMKKTVVFFQTNCPDAQGNQKGYSGTAFLLALADTRLNGGKGGSFTYLVTNRHVAQPGIEHGHPCQPTAYFLRADTKVPNQVGSYSMVVQIPFGQLIWTFPQDQSVDIAIAPIAVDTEKLDVIFLPSTLLLGKADVAQNRVEEGDSVMFTGLFVQLMGQTHLEPIVREGKIAMMPREQTRRVFKGIDQLTLATAQ
jgi:hypothetical protein